MKTTEQALTDLERITIHAKYPLEARREAESIIDGVTSGRHDLAWYRKRAFRGGFELAHRAMAENMRFPDDDCSMCAEGRKTGFAPAHYASIRCESGRHEHCSCDTCF